jgi:hypothetical protein
VAPFVSRLREFYGACGAPTYRSLVKTSQRLAELYPDFFEDRAPAPLSVTAISEVTRGHRAGPPRVAWVVTFVLSCQRRAYEDGVLDSDPGPETVPEWITQWHKAWAAIQTSNRMHLRGSSTTP